MALVGLGGEMAKTLGVREAAREFGLSETLIYNAVTRGQLPGVTRLGRRIILNRRLFEEFLEGQTVVDKNRLVARDALQVPPQWFTLPFPALPWVDREGRCPLANTPHSSIG